MDNIKKGLLLLIVFIVSLADLSAQGSITQTVKHDNASFMISIGGGNVKIKKQKEDFDKTTQTKTFYFYGTAAKDAELKVSVKALTRGTMGSELAGFSSLPGALPGMPSMIPIISEKKYMAGGKYTHVVNNKTVSDNDDNSPIECTKIVKTGNANKYSLTVYYTVHGKPVVTQNDDEGKTIININESKVAAFFEFDLSDQGATVIPTDVVVEADASEEAGEEGMDITDVIILIGGPTAGWIAGKKLINVFKNSSKKPSDTPKPKQQKSEAKRPAKKKEEEEEDEDEGPEEKEKFTYDLRTMKQFGNFLVPGGKHETIYARVVKIDKNGREFPDEALTRRIQIKGDGYIDAYNHKYMDGYMAAVIGVPPQDNLPEKVAVFFTMASELGSRTKKLNFLLNKPMIAFAQENLTLPACFKKEARVQFGILGLGEIKEMTAEISNEYYSVEIEEGGELKGMKEYFAVLTDKQKAPDTPGKFDAMYLHIKAVGVDGATAEGSLPVYRYHLGLKFAVNEIPSYIEEYTYGHKGDPHFVYTSGGKSYIPAEGSGQIAIYDFDEENMQLLVIPVVPKQEDIKFTPICDESVVTRDVSHINYEELVNSLGIMCQPIPEVEPDGVRRLIFRCKDKALDAPQRLKVKVEVKIVLDGKTYNAEKEALLLSQPRLKYKSTQEMAKSMKEDERHFNSLISIQHTIMDGGYYKNLFPVYKLIDIMIDGHDPAFGFDQKQLDAVKYHFTRFMRGESAGANATPEYPTWIDELDMFLANMKKTEDEMGFFTRLAVGAMTLGCADVMFTGLEVVREMKAYVDNGGDSVWGGFVVGTKIVGREYLYDKLMSAAVAVGGAAVKGAAATKLGQKVVQKGGEVLDSTKKALNNIPGSKAAKDAFEKTKKVLETDINPFGGKPKNIEIPSKGATKAIAEEAAEDAATKTTKQVSNLPAGESGKSATRKNKSARDRAKKKADSAPNHADNPKVMEEAEKLKAAKETSRQKIEDFQAADELCTFNNTPENRALRDKCALAVQEDKLAMFELKMTNNADDNIIRARLNRANAQFYDKADDMLKKKLAERYGVSPDKIELKKATSNERFKLETGQSIAMDRDLTAGYTDSHGNWHTFPQDVTENMYNDCYYKAANGIDAPNAAKAKEFAQRMDQTVVEAEKFHPESYSSDLDALLEHNFENVKDYRKLSQAMEYKVNHWLKRSKEKMEMAKTIANAEERALAEAKAMADQMEGLRQLKKQFDNYVDGMDLHRAQTKNVDSLVSDEFRESVAIIDRLFDSKDPMSVTAFEMNIKERGYNSCEELASGLGMIVKKIGGLM